MISIIVPIYNAAAYLHRCIDSILAQTYRDIEVLLIDDGSTDASPAICDLYANKDNRIHVVHKINGGVAIARQVGTDMARGEYSIHIDADDWVEPNMLEEMYATSKQTDADIVVADYYIEELDKGIEKTRIIRQKVDGCNSQKLLEGILIGHFWGAQWNKLIRHSLYKEHNAHYLTDIFYCEDVLMLAQILRHNHTVAHAPGRYYHYNKLNTQSITNYFTSKSYHNRLMFIDYARHMLTEKRYQFPIDMAEFMVHEEAVGHNVASVVEVYKHYPVGATYRRNIPIKPIQRLKYLFWHIYYKFVSL